MNSVIKQILSGDKEKFRLIIHEYNEELLRIAFYFARNWEDAKDVTQMTFIKAYRSLKKFDSARPFKPWLFRIHLNNCKSACRRQKWLKARHISLDSVELSNDSSHTSNEDLLAIMQHIQSLSLMQRAAFTLVEIENYNSKEAAEILGCSDSTLRVHLARAKQNLRNKLKDSEI